MKNKEIVKKAILFSGLAEENLVELGEIAVRRPFVKGETLFSEGDKAEGFYLLCSGALKLCKISPDGREKVLHMVHPVETFAEAAFFGDGSYPAEARGVEKGEVLFFPRGAFLGLLERNPRFSMNLIASLAMLLRRFARQIEELSFADAPSRLASYLIDLASRKSTSFQGRTYLELDMRKGELASRLGTVSETLSRTFKKLKDEEVIEVDGNKVTVLNMEKLKLLSGR